MSGVCKECNQPNTGSNWCKECNAKRFQQNFRNWTSGNSNIDKFIQDTQLSSNNYKEVLEWIPYGRFNDIEYIAKGGFGNVYKTNWVDGYIKYWDNKSKNWYRMDQNHFVALKSLNNSKNVTLKFINEITLHHKLHDNSIVKLYGITQDPETRNYMIVLQYAENGSLRNYLDTNKNYHYRSSWDNKIKDLHHIAIGLSIIHEKHLIHQDLHIGNILKLSNDAFITDMGLCKPADYNALENTNNNIYGVLPYVAPEILRGQSYTKASDIYSFGIIMYEVISGLPPYYDISHNEYLAMKICNGLRPMFNIKVPQLIVNLIKRCLDANPLNRPTALELQNILHKHHDEIFQWKQVELQKQLKGKQIGLQKQKEKQTELQKQIKEAEEINYNLQTNRLPLTSSLSYEIHAKAIYTSRLLNFNNLPEPKNSDDYYKQNDNLISKKFSEKENNNYEQEKLKQIQQNNKIKDSQEQLNQAKPRSTQNKIDNSHQITDLQNELRQTKTQLGKQTEKLANAQAQLVAYQKHKNEEIEFIKVKTEFEVREKYLKELETRAKGSNSQSFFEEEKNLLRELINDKKDHIKYLEKQAEASRDAMNKSLETIQAAVNTASSSQEQEKSSGEKINEGIKLISEGACQCLVKETINKVPFLSSLMSKN